jgi:hypothetical protein
MSQQQEIDFTRSEQLSILRRLPSSLPDDTGKISKRTLLAVLRSIDEYANSSSGWCWASQETLASYCCVSEKTVRRAVKWLDTAGLLISKQRGNGLTNLMKVVWGNLSNLMEDSLPESCNPDRTVTTPDRTMSPPDRTMSPPDRTLVSAISENNTVLDPVQQSGGVRENFPTEVPVQREQVLKLAESIRKTCRVGEKTIGTDLVWQAAMLGAATDWNPMQVAESIGNGKAGSPRAYLRGAIDRARDERGGITPYISES